MHRLRQFRPLQNPYKIHMNHEESMCTSGMLKSFTLEELSSPGTYAFSVQAVLPVSTPPQNQFSIILRQQPTETVVDAAFGLAGWPLVEIATSQPILAWTTAQLGEVSSVTVSFSMQNATGALRALLFNLQLGSFYGSGGASCRSSFRNG